MKGMRLAMVMLGLASGTVLGQRTTTTSAPDDVFNVRGPQSVPSSYPYGPGDRSATLKVKLLAGETTSNVEYWVLYSDDKSLLSGANIGSDFPQGKANLRVSKSNGDVFADFIFPHDDHATPNAKDVKPKKFKGGKKVYYQWVKKKGRATVESPVVEFTMPDKMTIVNMGDSYASGEGAPSPSGNKWEVEQSHRSAFSGQALAVKEYRKEHPGTAIDFLNVASSGAGVDEGIINSQKKKFVLQLPGTPPILIKPQVEQVADWLKQNDYETANIILLSIGINEIGFGEIVTKYLIAPLNIADDRSRREELNSDIQELKKQYQYVKDEFDRVLNYDKVVVSEYPDPTCGKTGKLCGALLDIPGYGLCWQGIELTSGDAEYKVAQDACKAMNARIKETVRGFGDQWEYGGGAMAASAKHGLCNCEEPWFNTIGASLREQLDVEGTWHPNRAGHREFVRPIILKDLKMTHLKLAQAYAKEAKDEKERAKQLAIEEAKRKARAKAMEKIKKAELAAKERTSTPIAEETMKQAEESAKETRNQGSGQSAEDPK